MKRIILLIFIMFALAAFQNTFFLEMFGQSKNPNFVLAFSLSLVAVNRKDLSILAAFIGGLFLDLFSPGIIGFSPVLFLSFIYIAIFIRNYLAGNIFVVLALVYVFSVFYPSLISLSLSIKPGTLFLGGIITSLAGVVFYVLNKKYVAPVSNDEYKF